MSSNSMASISSFSSPLEHNNERPDMGSIRVIIVSINQYIHEFIANVQSWHALKLKCNSRLVIQKQEFFEFSEQSVLSNLYWGIDNIEAAIQAKCPEEKTTKLKNSERMLQVPALLDELEMTAGVPNRFLVCCSYFYLAVVRNLQRDELQVALHFLQAILVFPRLMATEFAPEVCENLFPECTVPKLQQMGMMRRRSLDSIRGFHSGEESVSDSMRRLAKIYKHWLMYYQVLQCQEIPQRRISTPDVEAQCFMHEVSSGTESSSSKSFEHGNSSQTHCNKVMQYAKVHPFDPQQDINGGVTDEPAKRCEETLEEEAPEAEDYRKALISSDQVPRLQLHNAVQRSNSSIKRIQDMLEETQSDNSTPVDSCSIDFDDQENYFEENMEVTESSIRKESKSEYNPQLEMFDQKLRARCSSSGSECTTITLLQPPLHAMYKQSNEVNITNDFSERFFSSTSISDLDLSILELRDERPNRFINRMDHQGHTATSKKNNFNEDCLQWGKDSKAELLETVEKAISRLCFSEGLMTCDKDYAVEVTTIYEMLNGKAGVKYSMLKDVILEQLVTAISTSKEDTVIRASVSILTTIISANKSVLEDVKKKRLRLNELARALNRNVQEAAILIYLINPSPIEMKTLELLPTLVEVVCNSKIYKGKPESLQLTPPAASLMIIEVLVTAFDYATNNTHLAAINSPNVLCGLLEAARHENMEELISLATILVKCMQFDGQCRKYLAQYIPVAPLICLLQSNEKRATITALEFFHEILRMPRSSAVGLLQQIRKEGGIDVLHTLTHSLQDLDPDYQLFAANLLLQLDTLENLAGSRSVFREKPMQVLLKSVASEESSSSQLLSSFILANIGGTFSSTGEPYTIAWLVKKAGLISLCHQNLIKDFDWLDQSLQDAGIDSWCSSIAKNIIAIGKPVFQALGKGLKSKIKRVSQDCLTVVAWLGIEIAKSSNRLKHSASEILLDGVEQFLHPGVELQERLLACLCIYNYASGKGMQKVIHFSEGVRESLRRFSNVTWMAEELHRVADYYLPNKSRISCVHTQILEASHKYSGAVTALIYYKGLLYSGYTDGSIKVWDIKRQSAILVWDIKEHSKAVTCFSLFEPGESLLSGSADKTIRVWQMVHKKLELIEVIATKEPVRKLDTCGQMIFVITHGHRLKVFDSSRTAKDIYKNKNVKCMSVVQGRIYIGCTDSSIQELTIANNHEREIKAPTKTWRMQLKTKSINSIVVYKDCIYSASSVVGGSNIKEWRRQCEPQMSIVPEKGTNVLAMGVVEDFIYLNCSNSSSSSLQIWLRNTQHKVGRISSAGSKITSMLTANDIVLCGTETGLIKGWIPL
ncbi:hypothetical protein Dsin_029104 [Dipteronia sinensis]|uniref:E3 ubiquitin-protein ligase LIN-1 n=1 Tax=Dipteronia sinensis TaxID=43782 RepID=A0AAD9ZRZ6_9ROSI|nr:hypothetical protein Dsin_029104 [Dipteronia sinensis]